MIADEKIHVNVGISQLKTFLKRKTELRIIVESPSGKVHAAAAEHHVHASISDAAGLTYSGDKQIRGYVQYKDEKFEFYIAYQTGPGYVPTGDSAPGIKRLVAAGFERVKQPFDFVW